MRTLAAVAAAAACCATAHSQEISWALVVHGGAGVLERASMDPEVEAAYRRSLGEALEAGAEVLTRGEGALDAVETVIRLLEDDPLFNAGRGAVFTAAGTIEHDASIMDGATLNAGASAGTRTVRHPVSLARAVMERSRHVMLQGEGAEAFAAEQGLEIVSPAYFFTERRWRALEEALERQGLPTPPRPPGAPAPPAGGSIRWESTNGRHGTVGAVALDADGHLAAATSTGGLTAKRWGRVGDSPIIGAGTYANGSCGVSGTGTGEYFIRLNVAYRICALVELEELPIQEAADRVIHGDLTRLGGDGGVIAMTPDGSIAWSFNTPGMYRARITPRGSVVAIYGDEE